MINNISNFINKSFNLFKKHLYKLISKVGLTRLTFTVILIFIVYNFVSVFIYNFNIKEIEFKNYDNLALYFKDKKIDKVYFINNNSKIDMIMKLKNNELISVPAARFYEEFLFNNNIPYIWINKSKIKEIPELANFKEKKKYIFIERPEILINFLFMLLIVYILENSGMINIGLNKKFKLLFPEDIKGNIKDIIGLKEVKEEIKSLKYLIKNNNNHYKNFNILFSGPPGTGKTKMASYISKELNIPMIMGTGNLETGYVAGGVNVIKNLFETAEEIASVFGGKCLIFLDEAQVLLLKRNRQSINSNKWEDDTTNELLSNLDGINSKNNKNQIIFIAASNFDDSNIDMDEAIERRFQKKIYFRLPDYNERIELFDFYLKKYKINISTEDIKYLAEITSKLSPAKIETIVKETVLFKKFKIDEINKNDIIRTFEIMTIGHTSKISNREDEREIIIYHELGHFFVYYHFLKEKYNNNKEEILKNLKTLKISSESIQKYDALGFVFNTEEDKNLKTVKELEEEIMQLYGGVASEEYFYGQENITLGSYNDIEKITNLLNILVNKVNVYSNKKINYTLLYSENVLAKNRIEFIEDKASELYNETLKIIEKNRRNIKELKEILKKQWVLEKKDIEKLIKEDKIF